MSIRKVVLICTAVIALPAIGLAALGGGLLLLWRSAPNVVTADCGAFAAHAPKLFDECDNAVLSGRFEAGDRVHLAIDFKGVGYEYVLTGVIAERPNVTGDGWWRLFRRETKRPAATDSIVSSGYIAGFLTMDLQVDVKAAGDGAIVISKTSSLPSFESPRVTIASCKAAPPSTNVRAASSS